MRGYEYETNGYHRELEDEYEDEYYDQDEYEEEGSGARDEYVDEDPPEGQKEILEFRERLKEQIRRKAQAGGVSTAGLLSSSHNRAPATRDKFGSFFGPSQPAISQRVIEERKSLKELHSTIGRDPRPSGRDVPSSSKLPSKGNGVQHKAKIVNEAKKKAEALKDNRDYSFLLSDDAELPPSPKEKPSARPSMNQKPDREVMHSSVKSKASTSQPARLSNGYGSKNTLSAQRHTEAKTDSMRKDALSNRERAVSRDQERMHNIIRNGSNQANGSKTTGQKLPSKGSVATRHPSRDADDSSLRKNSVSSRQYLSEVGRPQSSQSQRMPSSGHRPQNPPHDQRSVQRRPEQSMQNRRPQQMSQGQRPQQSMQSQRVQQSMQSQQQNQSSLTQKSQLSQNHKPQSQSYRPQSLQGQRPISSQGQHSEQRRVQSNDRGKLVERQIRPPSKPMPSRPISSNGIRDDHAKRKPVPKRRFDEDEDEEDPLAMIRSMFRYDPSKYAGRDEDDSDMEADFATIEREEKRSARIARQEDEEQLRLIEEEERREQERKRRKMMMARGR